MSLLKDVNVLDFSTLLPGPYASQMLADFGANVLRIESATRLDITRELPPHDKYSSTAHSYLNRNKRSIALNLKKPAAIELVKKLVLRYDVVLEQFRPGVMDRLGIGYEALKEINPKLIFCSITGYGQTGPYKNRAGHDNNYLSIAGVSSYTGRQESGPLPLGLQVADIAGGSHHAVIGILAALYQRKATGEGQAVDVSMTDAAFAMNTMAGAGQLGAGITPEWESTLLNGGSFYGYYETRDGRWFSVGSLEPQFMSQLCSAIGSPELSSLGLSDNPEDQRTITETLRKAFLDKSFKEWEAIFADIDACVEPVLNLAEAAQHPQIQARNMVVSVATPDGDMQQQIASPIKFSEAQLKYQHIGVPVGHDRSSVFKELRLSEEEIEALLADEVVE